MLMEIAVLSMCALVAMLFLRSTFLKLLNARQEVHAKEYLFMINRIVSFQIRGLADVSATSYIFINLIPNMSVILNPPPDRQCSELSINDWQRYIQYAVLGLSILAFLDSLLLSCAVRRFTKTEILATLLFYYIPLTFFGTLSCLSFYASKDETVVAFCNSKPTPNEPIAWHLFVWRILPFLFLISFCAIVHTFHSHLTRLAAKMIESIFTDLKRDGVDKGKSVVLMPSDATLIHTELLDRERTMKISLFCDAENMRMWRKYFLSNKTKMMSVPSVSESLCRFSYAQARLYLGSIIYITFIIGVYYYTENFCFPLKEVTELRDFAFLMFTTLLTFNNIARVTVVAANDIQKEEATYKKIYNNV